MEENKITKHNGRGQPKKFATEDELIKLFDEFCDEIIAINYIITPSRTNFCKWLRKHYTECDIRTIYNHLNKYFPHVKNEFLEIQGSLLSQGAMLGKYKEATTIFCLKNWCKWTDKHQVETNGNEQSFKELKEILTNLNTPEKNRELSEYE